MTVVTRFAPSPTGFLHLGHAYSALFARNMALNKEGRFLLRIEDIDKERCRHDFETAILEDLAWLGLKWENPVRRQSDHFSDYAQAIQALEEMDLLYPCFCSRKEIRAEIKAAGYAPHSAPAGPEGPLYPQTCRWLDQSAREQRFAAGSPFAIRLKSDLALERTGPLTWFDDVKGIQNVTMAEMGDVVLARKDTPTSYHLSVTVDDHLQGITKVTRGEDLFFATHLHRLLQALLGYEQPSYHHHRLITDENGLRFAKRNSAVTLRDLRENGRSPEDIRNMINGNG